MIFANKHTCARSEAVIQRILLTVYFYYTITSVQITGRKLISVNAGIKKVPILESRRSPLYETRNNENNYQVIKGHPTEQFYLHDKEHHIYENPQVYKTPKYAYVLNEKSGGSFPKGQLYRLGKVRGTPSPRAFGMEAGLDTRPRTPYEPTTNTPPEDYDAPDTEGKKYAFAYAVRPKNGYTTVADDFSLSHKESRDGKVTMGEYKVLLPDGRLQIVRYTADGKSGFKADVTYEAEEAQARFNEHAEQPLERDSKAIGKPGTEIHKQFVPPPRQQSPQPQSHKSSAFVSKVIRTHPSLSPSLYYESSGTDDHHHQSPQYTQHLPPKSLNPSPTPPLVYYKISPSQYPAYKNPGSTVSSLLHKPPATTPKSIYDKIHHQGPNYAPVIRGQRAGPATHHYVDTLPSPYEGSKQNGGHDQNEVAIPPPASENPPFHYSRPMVLEHPLDSPELLKPRVRKHRILTQAIYPAAHLRVNKSALVPFTFHKAGPDVSESPVIEHGTFELGGASHEGHAQSYEHGEHHYILQEAAHEEILPAQHQRLVFVTPARQIPPIKSSLATFTSNLVRAGISTPKPPLYVKTKRVIPVGRPIKPSVGGLVYLETPATGPRPLRHDNLPRPKTTTHPYELGSKDYGNNVGYSPATEDSYKTIRTYFRPSQEIPPEYLALHNHPHAYPTTDNIY